MKVTWRLLGRRATNVTRDLSELRELIHALANTRRGTATRTGLPDLHLGPAHPLEMRIALGFGDCLVDRAPDLILGGPAGSQLAKCENRIS